MVWIYNDIILRTTVGLAILSTDSLLDIDYTKVIVESLIIIVLVMRAAIIRTAATGSLTCQVDVIFGL